MLTQLSLFGSDEHDFSHLAGLMPSIRAAMNRAAAQDEEGRKLLVDKINAIAASGGLRLTAGNCTTISKATLDKWLAPGDRGHTPSLLAVVVFCAATGNHEPMRVILSSLGLDVMGTEDRKLRDYGRACITEREARRRKRKLEDNL